MSKNETKKLEKKIKEMTDKFNQQDNEKILKILNQSLDEAEVFLHPERSQRWDDKFALLVVKHQNESYIIPVPVLKRKDSKLAGIVQYKIEEAAEVNQTDTPIENKEELIKKRASILFGDTYLQSASSIEDFTCILNAYINADDRKKVKEIADLLYSKEYSLCHDRYKFFDLAIRGYEFIEDNDKLIEIGDDMISGKWSYNIEKAISLYQKTGENDRILAIGKKAAEIGYLSNLEEVYNALNIDIPEKKLIKCGDANYKQKNYSYALKCYEKANYKEGMKKVANAYLGGKRKKRESIYGIEEYKIVEEKKENIQEAIQIFGKLGILKEKLSEIGDAYFNLEDLNQAVKYYRKANNKDKLIEVAKLWERSSFKPNIKEAIELYEEIKEISKDKYSEIAGICMKEGIFDLAVDCYKKAGKELPKKEIEEIVDDLVKQDISKHREKILEACKLIGANEKLIQLGRQLVKKKNINLALNFYTAANYEIPRSTLIKFGNIFSREEYCGDYERALKMYKKAGSKKKIRDLLIIMHNKGQDEYLDLIIECHKAIGNLNELRLLAYAKVRKERGNIISENTMNIFSAIAELELEKEEQKTS